MDCDFTKLNASTVLRVAWEGNIAVLGCFDCCMRWSILINGEECSDPGPIDVSLRQDLTDRNLDIPFDLYRPASVAGFCRGPTIGTGNHVISLVVGACQPSDFEDIVPSGRVMTGFNSVSRITIEEFPDQDVRCDDYVVSP